MKDLVLCTAPVYITSVQPCWSPTIENTSIQHIDLSLEDERNLYGFGIHFRNRKELEQLLDAVLDLAEAWSDKEPA